MTRLSAAGAEATQTELIVSSSYATALLALTCIRNRRMLVAKLNEARRLTPQGVSPVGSQSARDRVVMAAGCRRPMNVDLEVRRSMRA